jgi:hypothetical protein
MAAVRDRWTDERLDDLNHRVDDGFRRIDERFSQVDQRFAQVDQRFVQMDARFDSLQKLMVQGFIAMLGGFMAGFAVLAALIVTRL